MTTPTTITAKAKSLTDNKSIFYNLRKVRGILIEAGGSSVAINYADHTIAGAYDTVSNSDPRDIQFHPPYDYYLNEASSLFNITQNDNLGFAAEFLPAAIETNNVILDVKNTFLNTSGSSPLIVEEIVFRIIFNLSI